MLVADLRRLISDAGMAKQFKESQGMYIVQAKKAQLEEFVAEHGLESFEGGENEQRPKRKKKRKPIESDEEDDLPTFVREKKPRKKLGKNPDPAKLKKLREDKPVKVVKKKDPVEKKKERKREPIELEDRSSREEAATPTPPVAREAPLIENVYGLDQDDFEMLNNIVKEEQKDVPIANLPARAGEPADREEENLVYQFDETNEEKCTMLVALYPNLKDLSKSDKFAGSVEKYQYLESFLNRNKSCGNIGNYFMMCANWLEGNEIVNDYVKLKGYCDQLRERKVEMDMLIEEIKIKYLEEIGDWLDMPCEARLAMLFAETALATHMANLVKMNQRLEQLKERETRQMKREL